MYKQKYVTVTLLLLVSLIWAENKIITTQDYASPDAITIPKLLNYQGKLTNLTGNPVSDSTYSITFRLFTTSTGGSALWNETQNVQTNTGLFNVLLGSVSTIESIPQAGNCYLEMQVNPNTAMTPRIRLVSSAYAYLARKADTASYSLSANIVYVDSARISTNTHKLQGKDTIALSAKFVDEGQTNSITNSMIIDNAITSAKIQDGTIQLTDLAFTPVTRPLTPPVSNTEISDDAITSAKIQDGTITRNDVISNFKAPYADTSDYVRNVNIQYVDSARIATNTHKLQNKDTLALSTKFVDEGQANSIATGMVMDSAVTSPKLGRNAVTSDKIQDGTITRTDVISNFKAPYSDTADYARAAPAVDSARISANSYNAYKLQGKDTIAFSAKFVDEGQLNSISSTMIQDGAIIRNDAASNFKSPYSDTADYARVAPAVDSARVSAIAYNAYKLQGKDTSALDTRYVNEGQSNSVTSAMIQDNTIDSMDIKNYVVTNIKLAPNSVSTDKILNGSISTDDIEDGAITNDLLDRDAVTSSTILDSTITRADVKRNFKAPYADTADYVRNINMPYVDSARVAVNAYNAKQLQGKDTTALSAKFIDEGQTAGGDLTGTYPNPTITNNAVNTAKIADTNVTMAKIQQAGATSGQVLKWDGSAWVPSSDVGGSGEFLPLAGGTMTGAITNTGNPAITMGKGNFGSGNINSGTQAFVAGENNKARGVYSVVSGGGGPDADSNSAIGPYSAIGGGYQNIARGNYSTVGGGATNMATGDDAVITGGNLNTASMTYTTVSGGHENTASGWTASVSGGQLNTASGNYATVGGGLGDTANGYYATVSGGRKNKANGTGSFVGGGGGLYGILGNSANGEQSVIGGGTGNIANGDQSVIGGGGNNTTSGGSATVGGGNSNAASGNDATVSGGILNTASGERSTVGGGGYNNARGAYSVVGGGGGGTLADSNSAFGNYSMIPGGRANIASGHYSLAAGRRAKANHTCAFVWADSTNADFTSTGANQFLIRANGNVGINTNSPSSPLTVNGIIQSTTGGIKFPDNSVQTTAATGSSGTVTSVGTSGGLTGGPITTSGTISIADSGVITTKIANGNVTMAKINQASATTGQVIKWTGSAWAPANDSVATGSISGPAGGDLTGTYPNPTIANNAITSAKILDGTIKGVDIATPCTLEASISLEKSNLSNTNVRSKLSGGGAILNIKNNGSGDGIKIIDAGQDAVFVEHANNAGFAVANAEMDGVNVGHTVWDGMYVWRADIDGVYIDSAGNNGFQAHYAGNNGVTVDTAENYGVSAYGNQGGIYGKSDDGIGVTATSSNNDALKVEGTSQFTGKITSTASDKDAPIEVASSATCLNLNADAVDGIHGSAIPQIHDEGTLAATTGSVTLIIPHYTLWTLQLSSGWPNSGGLCNILGFENDWSIGVTYTKYNGDGTSAAGGNEGAENSTTTLVSFGSTGYAYSVECPNEASGDHNIILKVTSGTVELRYRLIY